MQLTKTLDFSIYKETFLYVKKRSPEKLASNFKIYLKLFKFF